jgi:UDP-galactopyranose mutase
VKHYDLIIAGAGFYGAVFAQQAREAGKSVLVLERRNHIAGNCHSRDFGDTNINVHTYGTHIFHVNDEKIWRYVNRFTEFNRYQHRVLTTHKNRVFAMPINLGTVNQFYGLNLVPDEVEAFIASKRGKIENPRNLEEKAISLIGQDLYEAFVKGYTIKQWGRDPKELPAAIIARLPVRKSYHDSYFNDRWQGIPVGGYTPIFERMLEGISVELEVDLLADLETWRSRCKTLVYTGPIDRWFDYQLGRLNWRSVRFETELLDTDDFQGTSVMNYADLDVPFTRIHEPRHLHLEKTHRPDKATVIVREFSQVDNEAPYYPVNAEEDKALLARYQAMAAKEKGVVFGGRLAEYKYYDMHQVIGSALAKSREVLSAM